MEIPNAGDYELGDPVEQEDGGYTKNKQQDEIPAALAVGLGIAGLIVGGIVVKKVMDYFDLEWPKPTY